MAKALDAMPAEHAAMYEAPIDTWYEVSAERVTPVNTSAAGEAMDWPRYADDYQDRIAAMLPDGTGTFGPQSGSAWAGLAAGLIGAAAIVVVASRRRTTQGA